jgi:sterol desaturase/sphingolipid hydroxylase (fatty acid hydroxylase superfamily)
MHHADLDFDAATGVPFHPIEIILSMLIKFTVIAAFGASAVGVLVFLGPAECQLDVQSEIRIKGS